MTATQTGGLPGGSPGAGKDWLLGCGAEQDPRSCGSDPQGLGNWRHPQRGPWGPRKRVSLPWLLSTWLSAALGAQAFWPLRLACPESPLERAGAGSPLCAGACVASGLRGQVSEVGWLPRDRVSSGLCRSLQVSDHWGMRATRCGGRSLLQLRSLCLHRGRWDRPHPGPTLGAA